MAGGGGGGAPKQGSGAIGQLVDVWHKLPDERRSITHKFSVGGHEGYRSHLVLMYLATLDPARGTLVRLEMVPFETRRLRLDRVSRADAEWLRDTLDRECGKLGARVELGADDALRAMTRMTLPMRRAHPTR